MTKNVIELNGQQYDARTGKPISKAQQKPIQKTAVTAVKNLDGFTRRATKPVVNAARPKQQKAQTLMRSAVKKPTAAAKVHAKTPAVAPSKPKITQQHTSLLDPTKIGRSLRANAIPKSSLISKFGKVAPTIKSEVLPVAPAPKKPAMRQAAEPQKPKATAAAPPITVATPARTNNFEQVIANAHSHELPKAKKLPVKHRIAKKLKVSPRLVSFIGTSMLAVGVAGFLAYQNLPEIAMKVASTRAGLNAKLPSYQPAGFAMSGPIKYETGQVTVNYKSNTDDRKFEVIQKNSSWNSETLLDNFVTASDQPYQTFQANGRTIYIYGDNKATWVDGGIWYNIDGKSNLNSDQLLRIASSL